jgi:putative oligomerization/nucleic acid binding protein
VFANGFIRFTVSDSPQFRGGVQSAITDENAVIFRRRQARGFNIVRAAVQDYISTHHGGAGGAGDPDIPEELEKLGKLHDQKLITDEEFEAKKAQLLDRL